MEVSLVVEGKKAIRIFANEDGFRKNSVRYTAKLKEIDLNKVFSPVVKQSSIRILLALVAQFFFGCKNEFFTW